MIFVWYLAIALAAGAACRPIMRSKGRSESNGFWIGFFLGLIGLIIVALLRPTREHEARKLRQRWAAADAQPRQAQRAPQRVTGTPDVASTTPALEFSSVSMVFPDGTHALRETSFAVHPGEFVTVVGPSGCGKSTLLRIASGLNRATTGFVTVDQSSLGYVFQDATLLPWRSVVRNVEMMAELEGVPRDERLERTLDAIDLVGLTGAEFKYPKQLSGGMKMRASLARSLVLNPKVFLFDEPFGAVDEITRERLNDEVIKLFQLDGFAGLFITHSISEAVFLSTRVLVMSARPGHIVADFPIPFPYPRDPELRFDPAFVELCGQISHELRGVHA